MNQFGQLLVSLWPWFAAVAALGGLILLGRINARREALLDWIEQRAHAYAEKHMTWRNKAVFQRRIDRRIRWLRFRRWLEQRRRVAIGGQVLRPVVVVSVFLLTLWGLHLAGVPLAGAVDALKRLIGADADKTSWQVALALVGAPVAFVLWLFRDIHAARTLENQRKDLNLKEFQEIQMRAAGALDEKLPAAARETLQIAAIHQLRPFLKGEYGDSFRRPAWEFLRARLRASAEVTGEAAIAAWVEAGGFPKVEGEPPGDRARRIAKEIEAKLAQLKLGPVTRAVRAVVREEADTIFSGGRAGRDDLCVDTRFDRIDFRRSLLMGENLAASYFVGADFVASHLEGANLRWAHLEGADLSEAHLEGAYLSEAHLEGAYLSEAHLEGADLQWAHLEGADLSQAHLEGAYLGGAHLEGAALSGAHLEGARLGGAHLEGAVLSWAHLEGADLRWADLEGAGLRGTYLEGADLSEAHLEGAVLSWAHLEGANLSSAVFDDTTILLFDQPNATPEALAAARQRLRDRGARHVDDPPEPAADEAEG